LNNKFGNKWQETLVKLAGDVGVSLNKDQLDIIVFHAQELIKWNKKFNITAIVDPFEILIKHFIDSFALKNHVSDNAYVLDLGSGGGFPGFPLKVIRPDLKILMADSSRKKISFLKYLIINSGLENIEAINARGEKLSQDKIYFNKFDFVVSRAFTGLDKFVYMSLPFLNEQGTILAMKGNISKKEQNSISKDKFDINVIRYLLAFEDHKRSIVKINKVVL